MDFGQPRLVSRSSACGLVVGAIPLGAEKWMTLPSDLNMLTSSMAWMGWTFIFLRVVCSFLSSVPWLLCTFLTFLLGVPLPLQHRMCQSGTLAVASFPNAQYLYWRCCDMVGGKRGMRTLLER